MGAFLSSYATISAPIPLPYILEYACKIDKLEVSTEHTLLEIFQANIFEADRAKQCKDATLTAVSKLYNLLRTTFGNIFGSCFGTFPEGDLNSQFGGLRSDIDELQKACIAFGEQTIFSMVIAAIIGFFRTVINYITSILRKIKNAIQEAAEYCGKAFKYISKATENLAEEVSGVVGPHAHAHVN